MSGQPVIVVAGVIFNGPTVLVTQRMRGAHLEGTWEFPGGKLEDDESPEDALARELREEIGVECDVGEVLDVTYWRYEKKRVLLIFYAASIRAGEVTDLGVAAHRWATLDGLDGLAFPPADERVLERVRQALRARAVG